MRTISKIKNDYVPLIKGDLFDYVENYVKQGNTGFSVVVPHVCNNIDLFGAGFASAVAKHYPIVKENYHLLGHKNKLGYVQYVEAVKNKTYNHKLIFANMIAQNGIVSNTNTRPLNYYYLSQCMADVSQFIRNNFYTEANKVQIHTPKFGCGLAGGNWNFIVELIKDIWNNQTVFVYQK